MSINDVDDEVSHEPLHSQGSVLVKKFKTNISETLQDNHIDNHLVVNQSLGNSLISISLDGDEQEAPKDALFLANKLKSVFKRSEEDGGIFSMVWKVVEVPLNFLRDYTVPMAESAEWDRNRAVILPFCIPWAFCLLQGWLTTNDDSVDSD